MDGRPRTPPTPHPRHGWPASNSSDTASPPWTAGPELLRLGHLRVGGMGSWPRWWSGEIRWCLGGSGGEVMAPATGGDIGHLLPFPASSSSKRERPCATANSSSGRRTRGRGHAIARRMTPVAPPGTRRSPQNSGGLRRRKSHDLDAHGCLLDVVRRLGRLRQTPESCAPL